MDAFVRGSNIILWGTCSAGHSGRLGRVCDIMGCELIADKFTEAHVLDITSIAIGQLDQQNELITDYQWIWPKTSV